MSKSIQKINPLCPLHTLAFDTWALLNLSSSYVYSFCRKELFPVEQKSFGKEIKLCELQFTAFYPRVQKEVRRKTKTVRAEQLLLNLLWHFQRERTSSRFDLPASPEFSRTFCMAQMVSGPWSFSWQALCWHPHHCLHQGKLGRLSSVSTALQLVETWTGMYTCVCAYKPKEVWEKIGSDGEGPHGPQDKSCPQGQG